MRTLLRPALGLFIVLSVLTGVVYPLAVTGIAAALFPEQARGSLIVRDGQAVGSRLIGQAFSAPQYFWGRPSATGGWPNNGLASGGSNLGPLNAALSDAVKARLRALHAVDPGNPAPVPLELVTASGSGLDPHIGPGAARYQVARVARVRGLSEEAVERLVKRYTRTSDLGLFGAARVNVLELNLALDETRR